MKYNLVSLFGFIVVLIVSCNTNEKQKENKPDSIKVFNQKIKTQPKQPDSLSKLKTEEKIIDTVFNLKEVQAREEYVEKQTKGERKLQVLIADTPNTTNKYYWVKVEEDNGDNLVTHFNFFVYPESMHIMFYDPVTDEELTLDEWRKKIIPPSNN